jgi:hypothetical protein
MHYGLVIFNTWEFFFKFQSTDNILVQNLLPSIQKYETALFPACTVLMVIFLKLLLVNQQKCPVLIWLNEMVSESQFIFIQ